MRFSMNTVATAATVIASFFAVANVVVANDVHSAQHIRGQQKQILEQVEVEAEFFWTRNLQMSVDNDSSYNDSHDDHDEDEDHEDHDEDEDKDGHDEDEDKDGHSCPTTADPVNPEIVRAALREFVNSLDDAPLATHFNSTGGPSQLARAYHPNADEQVEDYHFCTIVQQCLDPHFVLSLGYMTAKSRGLAYAAASAAMSTESFLMLQLQQHSNMLLGEMQDWATICDGTCRMLNDADGLLKSDYTLTSSFAEQSTEVPDTSYVDCGKLKNIENKNAFWYCNDEPRMIHVANLDVDTGRYKLGNVWNEPRTHGRNSHYDYISVYGSLDGPGKFGMRFTGHHFDINYRWNEKGDLVQDTPAVLGHNPFVVPPTTPPPTRQSNERANERDHTYQLMWQNMAGVQQFAESERLILAASKILATSGQTAYMPLEKWKSTGYVGLVQPQFMTDGDSKTTIKSNDHWDLSTASESDFDTIWALVGYTLKFTRGNQPMTTERELFRNEGKAVWTTILENEFDFLPVSKESFRESLNFFILWIETEDWLFVTMINAMYCVASEFEPSNHLHSILVEKAMITPEHACVDGKDDPVCYVPSCEDEEDVLCDGHSHGHRSLFS